MPQQQRGRQCASNYLQWMGNLAPNRGLNIHYILLLAFAESLAITKIHFEHLFFMASTSASTSRSSTFSMREPLLLPITTMGTTKSCKKATSLLEKWMLPCTANSGAVVFAWITLWRVPFCQKPSMFLRRETFS